MVFIRRRVAKRRVYRKRKGMGARPSVAKLARVVKGLVRKEKVADEYINLGQFNSYDSMVSPYSIVNLCNYTGMAGIFGTASDDRTDNKIVHQSMGMDIRVSLENTVNNEENTVNFTAFLVSLRDQASAVFTPSNGALSLTADVHYYSTSGCALLNKKIFKIHKFKRFTLSNYGTALTASAAQTQYGTDIRWYWKHSPRTTIVNPAGGWSSLGSALDPSKQYYLIVFNDNTAVDGESPTITTNVVHTLKKCK